MAGRFVGDTRAGGSCNCELHTLAPHCHGTHTECVGHVTRSPVTIASLTPVPPCLALVISVTPAPLGSDLPDGMAAATDLVIRRETLADAATPWQYQSFTAVVVRTLPNPPSKQHRAYAGTPSPAPYFLPEAMQWLVERQVT